VASGFTDLLRGIGTGHSLSDPAPVTLSQTGHLTLVEGLVTDYENGMSFEASGSALIAPSFLTINLIAPFLPRSRCGSLCNRGHANHEAIGHSGRQGDQRMMTILIVLVVLMLLGAIPAWPHSRNWGYGPSGGLGLILLIVVILLMTGRI